MSKGIEPGDIIRHVPRPRPSLGRLRVESVVDNCVLARSLETGAVFELDMEELEREEPHEDRR